MNGRHPRLVLVLGLAASLVLAVCPAFAQHLTPLGPVVDLSEACGATVRLLENDGQWMAMWRTYDPTFHLEARRGSDLWSLGPTVVLTEDFVWALDAVSQPGGFAAAWFGPARGYLGIFQNDLTPIGSPIALDESSSSENVAIAATPTGELMVAWSTLRRVYARRFSPTGIPLTPPMEVSPLGDYAVGVDIAQSASSFLVTWRRFSFTTGSKKYTRAFDMSGTPLGPEALLGEGSSGSLAPRDEGYLLLATSPQGSLVVHALDITGVPQAAPSPLGFEESRGTVMASDGRRAWAATVVSDYGGIAVQEIDAQTGAPVASPELVAEPGSGVYAPSLLVHGDGLAVAWEGRTNWPNPEPPCGSFEPSQATLFGFGSPVDVPALGPGGLALFALLLTASAWWVRR